MNISHDIIMVSMPLVKGKPYATDDVWNCHRSIITRLYRDEKKPLKQLKEIMERDYNLFATERMFKTRIKSWGIDKKLKEAEVMRILQLKKEREAAGKNSRLYIRNQQVDWERVANYLSRRPDLRNKPRSLAPDPVAACLDIICRTPSPSPSISALLNGPPETRLPEEIMRIFETTSMGHGTVCGRLQGDDLYGYDRECGRARVDQMYGDLGNAKKLLKRNKLEAAFRIINQSLDSLGRTIKDQDPDMFYTLSYRTLQLNNKIAEPLIVFISEMHAVVLGPRHPLSLVWDKFKHISRECRARTICMMAFDSARFLETRLGILNRATTSVLITMTGILYRLGATDGREFGVVLSKYATATETYFAERDTLRSCKCLLQLAGVQLRARQYEPARVTLARTFTLIQDSNRSPGNRWHVMKL
ncbi:hypothetical protein LY78DRAFT_679132 [Colletotrichum sublineola]|nr:hypothetical protein LY78DRAFT_679132 [Colletotrichum sublineola]